MIPLWIVACLCGASLIMGVIRDLWASVEEVREGVPADAAQFMFSGKGEW
jgi:hypothetical protein